MKKLNYVLSILGMMLFVANAAQASVKTEMFAINGYVSELAKAQTAEEVQKVSKELREVAMQAKNKQPTSVDEANLPGYQQGMQHFIDTVAEIEKLAQEGKLEEAKNLSKQLQVLKKEYHSKYK